MKIEAFFYDDEHDCELLAVGEYHPECRGSRDFYGLQIEPDYHESIEVVEISKEDGEEVELSSSILALAQNALWDALPDRD